MKAIEVTPEVPVTGSPVSIRVHMDSPSVGALKVSRIDGTNPPPFESPLYQQGNGEWTTQFAIYQKGTYELQVGSLREVMEVKERVDLSFLGEFSLWGSLVAIILGGLILWSRRNQEKKVGSS